MKNLKILLAMLVLALIVVGCRTVPSEVMVQHGISLQESDEALGVAEQTLKAVEAKSDLLSDELVTAAFVRWTEHVERIMAARGVVHQYLLETKADLEVTSAYSTGHKLLMDMHRGFNSINRYWEEMLTRDTDRERFIELFRKDIERFQVLERKFDEWISQFRVKG